MSGNLPQARHLERIILQRLTTEAADRAAVERQVRELLAPLVVSAPTLPPEFADPFDVERGSDWRQDSYVDIYRTIDPTRTATGPSAPTQGIVYPVWFGTNRQPNPRGGGFTGERHRGHHPGPGGGIRLPGPPLWRTGHRLLDSPAPVESAG